MYITEAAKYLGYTTFTLQRLDREGKLKPIGRTATNRRIYSKEQLDRFLGRSKCKKRKTIVYCRVSSNSQKNDLKSQRQALETFVCASGIAPDEYIEEIGSGLNFKRKKFNEIMDLIGKGEISNLIIAHKDRLVRFGFDWFEHYCDVNDCKITIMNNETLSPREEMVNDLMTIINCFSSRLYGLRSYKPNKEDLLKE